MVKEVAVVVLVVVVVAEEEERKKVQKSRGNILPNLRQHIINDKKAVENLPSPQCPESV